MTHEDVDFKVMRGRPILIEGLGTIYPLLIDEIVDIGENKYNQYISALLFNKNNLDDLSPEAENLSNFEVMINLAYHIDDFRQTILDSLSLFFKEKANFHENGFFYFGDLMECRFIDEKKYSQIVSIIKKQNYLTQNEEQVYKPHNDAARRLIEKKKQVMKKLQKQNKEEGLNLKDIVSIVASHSNDVNFLSVWNLNVYQLYEAYVRLLMQEEYEKDLFLLPHADNPNEALKSLKHWARKIPNK